MSQRIRVGLYGDVDLNYIDGSSVWLVSLCTVLGRIPGVEVELVLKAPIDRTVLTGDLPADKVRLHEPSRRRTVADAVNNLVGLDEDDPFDVVILRGRQVTHHAAQGELAPKLWAYLTDVPQQPSELDSEEGDQLRFILAGAARVLCQTEDMRAWFASIAPESDSKLVLLPPMVPDEAYRPHVRAWGDGGLRLFYAGKFAPDWGFLEVIEQVSRLRHKGIDVSLVVAGDKIHDPPSDPTFAPAVREALDSDFVDWRGGISRSEVLEALDEVDLALSVRSSRLDTSRELSTKLLEYSAAAVPVVANLTLAHQSLFGDEYPFLVSSFDELGSIVESVASSPDALSWAGGMVRRVADDYSYSAVAETLGAALRASVGGAELASGGVDRLLVAGHDMKFMDELVRGWETQGIEVDFDHWSGHSGHDPDRSVALAEAADIVVCEWMLGNAEFHARNAPKDTPVVVRLHRMEVNTDWPALVPIQKVSSVVVVSEHLRREVIQRFGFPSQKVAVIPNAVDTIAFHRPKLPRAEFTLGLLGYLPRLKRLDRAVGLLERLLAVDGRYRLVVKGKAPEELSWVWNDRDERAYFEMVRKRIESDPALSEAVSFETASADTPSWFRKVGYILSPSDIESFHLALTEGMASGAVPVVWEREGATEIVHPRWVHGSTADAAEWIEANAERWTHHGEEAASLVEQRYSSRRVRSDWDRLLLRAHENVVELPTYEDLVPETDRSAELATTLEIRPGSLRMPYRYAVRPVSDSDRDAVASLSGGLFQPSKLFEPIATSMPPDWVENPLDNRTWDFHRHSLEWLEPIIRVAAEDPDVLDLLGRILVDWIGSNSEPPGRTPYVWSDHTAAIRTRVLLFGLFTLSEAGRLDDRLRMMVSQALVQHGAYLADPRFYAEGSNHGLEMDASLLALTAVMGPGLIARRWREIAESRLVAYFAANYSKRGFHLEQSPGYHLFVTVRLMSIISFCEANDLAIPAALTRVLEKAIAVWPFLRRPDNTVPMIGDTPQRPKPVDFGETHLRLLGRKPRSVAPQDMLNPRGDGCSAFVDAEAGYAVYSDREPTVDVADDTLSFHAVVKCNTFSSPHYHHDAGSIVLWADGLEWLVDSGYYSMEERTLERRFMRSSRAHNVVVVDDEDFEFRPFRVVDVFRDSEGDGLEMLHDLGSIRHRRRVRVSPLKRQLVIHDQLVNCDDRPHSVSQLFHLHPTLNVRIVNPFRVEAEDRRGRLLTVTQDAEGALVDLGVGDEEGRPTSWFSEDYLQREPSTVVRTTANVADEYRFTTTITVGDAD